MVQENDEAVPAGQAHEAVRAGTAVVVDIRDSRQFDSGHPVGALNLPYSARGLASRVSDLLAAAYGIGSPPVILIAGDEETAQAALEQLGDTESLSATVITGGIAAWVDAGLPVETVEEIDVGDLAPDVRADNLITLDVREPIEWEMGHVPGALLISLGELGERVAEVPTNRPVAVISEAGVRSAMAASILCVKGHGENLLHAVAGTAAYRGAGLPMEYAEAEIEDEDG